MTKVKIRVKNLSVLLATLLIFQGSMAWAQDALHGVASVSIRVKDLNSDAEKAGLAKEKVGLTVVSMLRQRGVPMNDNPEGDDETPALYVTVTVAKFFGGFAGSYRLQMRDWAASLRDPSKRILVSTWEKGGILTATKGKFRSQIEAALKEMAQAFAKDYHAANGKN